MIFHRSKVLCLGFRLSGAVLMATASPLVAVAGPQDPTVPLSSMGGSERALLESRLAEVATAAANARAFFDPDMRPISIRAAFDVSANKLIFHMDGRFGPEAGYTEMTDLGRTVEEVASPLLDHIEGLGGIEWRYGGKSTDYWLRSSGSTLINQNVRPASATAGPVLVAAGHGMYYHHGFKDWRPHRSEKHGLIEDYVTPKLSEQLVTYLRLNQVPAEEVRSSSAFATHPQSGRPFWEVGARYHLAALLPNLPAIWHSLPNSDATNREAREDHKSRPLYANYVGAPAIFHVHTNAVEPPNDVSTRGARTYVFPGRAEDAKLARLVLCGMSELIHSVEKFRDFPVAAETHTSDQHAETSLAQMPAVIVETAYHTHPDDAALLKDPEFHKLSMMGVAKGYRLYTEGRSCEPFVASSQGPVEAFVGQQVKLPVPLSGNPYYPVDLRYTPSRCLKEPCRTKGKMLFSAAEVDAFRINYICGSDDVAKGPIDYEIFAKDAYGVSTNRVFSRLICKARTR